MEQITFINRGILLLHTQKWKIQVMKKINQRHRSSTWDYSRPKKLERQKQKLALWPLRTTVIENIQHSAHQNQEKLLPSATSRGTDPLYFVHKWDIFNSTHETYLTTGHDTRNRVMHELQIYLLLEYLMLSETLATQHWKVEWLVYNELEGCEKKQS
jgi:hypothetical protein